MYVNAGEFDRRITLQLNTPTADAATNAPQDSWATLSTVWARVVESVGRHPADAGSSSVDEYGRPIEVWIRWYSTFDRTLTRVVIGSRTLRIVASAEVSRRSVLKLACVEWAHG